MGEMKANMLNWKDKFKSKYNIILTVVVIILVAALIGLSIYVNNKQKEYRTASENV